jgi:hypothetical protein
VKTSLSIVSIALVALVGSTVGAYDASVAQMLAKFANGDTGTYAVKGTRGTVRVKDGVLVDGIAQAEISPAASQSSPTVTSSVVTVSNRKYTVYDYADPATKKFCVVIPEDLKTVRGLLVECNYAGGDCDLTGLLPLLSRIHAFA